MTATPGLFNGFMTDEDREDLLAKLTKESQDKVPGYTALITSKGIESMVGSGILSTLVSYGVTPLPQKESRDFAIVSAYHEQQAQTVPIGIVNYAKAFFEQLLGFKNDAPTSLDPNMGFFDHVYARAGELVAYDTAKDASKMVMDLAKKNDPNILEDAPDFKDKVAKYEKAIYSVAYKAAMQKVGHPVSDTVIAATAEKAQQVASNDYPPEEPHSGIPPTLNKDGRQTAIN